MLQQGGPAAARGGQMTVEQLMTPSPVSVELSTTALDLAQLFYSLRFRHFLVKDGSGKLVGLISDHDVVRCFGIDRDPTEAQLAQVTAQQIMSTELVAVSPDTTVTKAVNLMLQNGINSLPVTVGDHAVGIVTSTDLFVLLEELLQTAELDCEPENLEPELADTPG